MKIPMLKIYICLNFGEVYATKIAQIPYNPIFFSYFIYRYRNLSVSL